MTSTLLLGLTLMAAPLLALAQATPAALADCAAIAGDSERLACFDRISGRAARPAAEPKKDAAPAPAASAPSSEGTTTTVAAPAGSGSMYDKAWSFDPSTPALRHLAVRAQLLPLRPLHHRPEHRALRPAGRRRRAGARHHARLHRGRVPAELQVQAVDHRRPPLGRVGRLHAAKPMAAVQRLGQRLAALPRDQLHARADPQLQARPAVGRAAVEPAQPGLQPPVERPLRHPVAQLEPHHRQLRRRKTATSASSAGCGGASPSPAIRTTTRPSPTTTAGATCRPSTSGAARASAARSAATPAPARAPASWPGPRSRCSARCAATSRCSAATANR